MLRRGLNPFKQFFVTQSIVVLGLVMRNKTERHGLDDGGLARGHPAPRFLRRQISPRHCAAIGKPDRARALNLFQKHLRTPTLLFQA